MSTPTGCILYSEITSEYLFPLLLPVKKVRQSVERQILRYFACALAYDNLWDSRLKKY